MVVAKEVTVMEDAVGVTFVKDLVTMENHPGLLMVMEYSGRNSGINFVKKRIPKLWPKELF